MSEKPSFFAELKRRNVYKVAVAYAVVAWLLVQVTTQVFPFFEVPNWAVRLVVLLLILGFPIALILAWAFELTPEGIKRTESTDELPNKSSRSRAWIYAVIIAGALSLGLFFFGRYLAKEGRLGGPSLPEKSIAVLPFESLSEDKSNAYFADGIQDEILARLSKIADLKVISRTSTQKYKSAPDDLREIAQKLGVANILEGSVQKSNDQVRVTVQLINALNDSHLWAETYDRKLSDVFGVESDIAQRIVGSLEARLTGREKEEIAFIGTKNPQAYDALLHAIALQNSMSQADWAKRIEFCRRAVALDPNYADAWATLAIAEAAQFGNPWQKSEELKESVRVAAETALRLAPDSAKAHRAMGWYYRYCRKDFKAALAELEFARDRAPNDGGLLYDLGGLQRAQGKIDESIASMTKAAALDPLNIRVWTDLAATYEGLRQFDEARGMLDRALAIAPDDLSTLAGKALIYQAQGDLDAAWKVIGPHPMPPLTEWAFTIYYEQYYLWRDYGYLIALLKGLDLDSKNVPPLIVAAMNAGLANLYLLNGQRDLAIPCVQRAEREMRALREQKLIHPDVSGWYIECAARFGNRDEVEREIEFLFAETRDHQWLFPYSEYSAAVGYALLGDLDKAFPLLRDALDKPTGITAAWLRLRPEWDSVRSDPRFQKLANSRP
jgi:TolB-like protein